jgi:hypothetical protein
MASLYQTIRANTLCKTNENIVTSKPENNIERNIEKSNSFD